MHNTFTVMWMKPIIHVLGSSTVDCVGAPIGSNQRLYQIGIFCFSAKHAALRGKSKDWLAARNQGDVSEWGDMCLSADCCFSEQALYKSN